MINPLMRAAEFFMSYIFKVTGTIFVIFYRKRMLRQKNGEQSQISTNLKIWVLKNNCKKRKYKN